MWNSNVNDIARADAARDAYMATADLALDRLQAIVDNPASSPAEVADARSAIDAIREEIGFVGNCRSDIGIVIRTNELNERISELLDGEVDAAAEGGTTTWIGDAFDGMREWSGVVGLGQPSISDGAALYEKMSTDPRGFASFWKDLSPEDRQLAMFTLQTYVQDQNQLTTMMTNMLSASHQTASAIARNLSV